MPHYPLPLTDLAKLADQVLSLPPASALPCNLSDDWLALISRDLAGAFDEIDISESMEQLMAAPLALVIHILRGQGTTGQEISHEEAMGYLNAYRIEVALELVTRKTDVKSTPATMATIFRQRDIMVDLF